MITQLCDILNSEKSEELSLIFLLSHNSLLRLDAYILKVDSCNNCYAPRSFEQRA